MAKRTPRSEADDVTAAPATGRKARAGAKPTREAASRGREVGAPTAAGEDQPGAVSDTFVGEPDTLGEPGQGEDRAATSSTSMASEPSEEDIRMRAYHRYLERGGGHGMDYDDWIQAERELRNKNS